MVATTRNGKLAALMMVLALAGCAATPEVERAGHPLEEAESVGILPDDGRALEAVLLDVLYPWHLPYDAQRGPGYASLKSKVVLVTRTTDRVFAARSFEGELARNGCSVAAPLVRDSIARNSRRVSVPDVALYASSDHVLVERLPRGWGFRRDYPDARCFVELSLPAYSDDGTLAVVLANVGPVGWHPASGAWVLERRGRRWVVRARFFIMGQ